MSHNDEREPLLASTHESRTINIESGPPKKKEIGIVSAIFLIFNRMVGVGIFATPSMILRLSGSVGLSLCIWAIGGVIVFAGMYVYIIWGTALPRNGAEKNYLEHLFQRPKHLVSCMFAASSVLLIWAAGNAVVFGEYLLRALALPPEKLELRLVAFAAVLFATLLHGSSVKWGLRLQNALGLMKLAILAFVVITGIVAASGRLADGAERPSNFEDAWEGTTSSASALCFALFNVIYSFHGFSNANYALAEVRNPHRTIRIAGFSAVLLVTICYTLVVLAYLAGVPKDDIAGSGQLVAALLFRRVWGRGVERLLSACVALSALGGVLGITFSQGRVNQVLGKEGILPASRFFASSKPFGAPSAGLSLHCFMCLLVIFALPPGDAYQFILNCSQYPVAIINLVLSLGLLYLSHSSSSSPSSPTPRSSIRFPSGPTITTATSFYALTNLFLVIVPLLPPPPGGKPYEKLPYYAHSVGAWGVLLVGAGYWVVRYWVFGRERREGDRE